MVGDFNTPETLEELYQHNIDFKRYVDSYAVSYNHGKGIPVKMALTHLIVKNYARYLKENNDGKVL